MSSSVYLLLLLSALLSALTGAGAAMRPQQAAASCARAAESAVAAVRVAPVMAVRPDAGLPGLAAVAELFSAPFRLGSAPQFLSSRRE